jgi:hypothetical protein
MLQIFVPVATALLAAVVAYRYSLRADQKARITEARLEIQREALAEGQQAFANFWISIYKILVTGNFTNDNLNVMVEQTSIQLAVTYSRLQDQRLAEKLSAWQDKIALVTTRVSSTGNPMPTDQARVYYDEFIDLCNQLGASLRELSSALIDATQHKPKLAKMPRFLRRGSAETGRRSSE